MFIKQSLQNLQSTLKALGYSRTFNIELLASAELKKLNCLKDSTRRYDFMSKNEFLRYTSTKPHDLFIASLKSSFILKASTFRFKNKLGLKLENSLPCQRLIMSYLQHKLNISCKKPFFVAKNCFFRSFKTVYAILFSSLCNIFQK